MKYYKFGIVYTETDGSKYSEAEHKAGAEGPDLMSRFSPSVALSHPLHHLGLELLDDERYLDTGYTGLQHVVSH